MNVEQGVHQSALKYNPTVVIPHSTSAVGRFLCLPEMFWPSCTVRVGPRMLNHGALPVDVMVAESDGLRPPGTEPGVTCQGAAGRGAPAAPVGGRDLLSEANADLRRVLIAPCRSGETVHTTWLYLHPDVHRPSSPKLAQSPFRPTRRSCG